MGNTNTHKRDWRKSGVPDTGLSIENIRSPAPVLSIGGGGQDAVDGSPSKKTPPPSFQTSGGLADLITQLVNLQLLLSAMQE